MAVLLADAAVADDDDVVVVGFVAVLLLVPVDWTAAGVACVARESMTETFFFL